MYRESSGMPLPLFATLATRYAFLLVTIGFYKGQWIANIGIQEIKLWIVALEVPHVNQSYIIERDC